MGPRSFSITNCSNASEVLVHFSRYHFPGDFYPETPLFDAWCTSPMLPYYIATSVKSVNASGRGSEPRVIVVEKCDIVKDNRTAEPFAPFAVSEVCSRRKLSCSQDLELQKCIALFEAQNMTDEVDFWWESCVNRTQTSHGSKEVFCRVLSAFAERCMRLFPALFEAQNMTDEVDFWWESCVNRTQTSHGSKEVFCRVLSAFAERCMRLFPATPVPFRSVTVCSTQFLSPLSLFTFRHGFFISDADCGYKREYKLLTSACQPTCDQPSADKFCPYPPIAGCVCLKGTLLHNGDCVPEARCKDVAGCMGDGPTPYQVLIVHIYPPCLLFTSFSCSKEGESWLSADCLQKFTCGSNGSVTNVSNSCSLSGSCVINVAGQHVCECNAKFYGNGCKKLFAFTSSVFV